MDSVLRGNFGLEVLTLIEELNLDAAVIFPAFPNEGRTTVGGFHLLKGIPVQRTDVSRDPACPVSESNILSLVKSQIGEEKKDLVGLIAIDTIMKGAGPILIELNELNASLDLNLQSALKMYESVGFVQLYRYSQAYLPRG